MLEGKILECLQSEGGTLNDRNKIFATEATHYFLLVVKIVTPFMCLHIYELLLNY